MVRASLVCTFLRHTVLECAQCIGNGCVWVGKVLCTYVLRWILFVMLAFLIWLYSAHVIFFLTGYQKTIPVCAEGYILLASGAGCIPNTTDIVNPVRRL